LIGRSVRLKQSVRRRLYRQIWRIPFCVGLVGGPPGLPPDLPSYALWAKAESKMLSPVGRTPIDFLNFDRELNSRVLISGYAFQHMFVGLRRKFNTIGQDQCLEMFYAAYVYNMMRKAFHPISISAQDQHLYRCM
jgi:hypothetical protein